MGGRAYARARRGDLARQRSACWRRCSPSWPQKFQPLVDALNEVSESSYRHTRPGHPAPVRAVAEDRQRALLRAAQAPRRRSHPRRRDRVRALTHAAVSACRSCSAASTTCASRTTSTTSWSPTARACRTRPAAARPRRKLLVAPVRLAASWRCRCTWIRQLLQRLARGRSARAPARGQRRRLPDRARGREPLPVPRLERRPRPAGVAARAGDAGRGRQVHRRATGCCGARSPGHFPLELRRVLFERARLDPRLERARAGLYREASRYAQTLLSPPGAGAARARTAGSAGSVEQEGGAGGAAALLPPDQRAQARAHRADQLGAEGRRGPPRNQSRRRRGGLTLPPVRASVLIHSRTACAGPCACRACRRAGACSRGARARA